MFFTQPDGSKTHYDIWDVNPQAESEALLLHGNLASNRWWLPLLSHWPRTQTISRFIAAEWRGCGLSDAPRLESELHPKSLAADMAHLIDVVCNAQKPLHVIGHSTGGLIGVCLALLKPEKIAKLVLIDAVSPRGIKFEPTFLKLFDAMRTNRKVCAEVLLSTIYGTDTSTAFFSTLVDDATRMANLNWRGVLNQLSDVDFTCELKNIRCPVFILQGEHDEVCPMVGAETYRKYLPQSELMILQGRGHCPIVENPAKIAGLINQFLDSENLGAARATDATFNRGQAAIRNAVQNNTGHGIELF